MNGFTQFKGFFYEIVKFKQHFCKILYKQAIYMTTVLIKAEDFMIAKACFYKFILNLHKENNFY